MDTPIDGLDMTEELTLQRAQWYLFCYGQHFSECAMKPCTCGFAEAWKHAGLVKDFETVIRNYVKLRSRGSSCHLLETVLASTTENKENEYSGHGEAST